MGCGPASREPAARSRAPSSRCSAPPRVRRPCTTRRWPGGDCSRGNRLVNIGNMLASTPVTAVIPTLNEANQIADCVRAVTWADEVIVADGGSSDETPRAAAAAGAKVLQGSWNTIAAQRNAAIAAARNRWVLAAGASQPGGPGLAEEIGATV